MRNPVAKLFHERLKCWKNGCQTAGVAFPSLEGFFEADFTVSLRSASAPLVVTEEESIPEPYWKPQAPKLDRQGLIAALKSGEQVSGAVLGNPRMTIAIRTK